MTPPQPLNSRLLEGLQVGPDTRRRALAVQSLCVRRSFPFRSLTLVARGFTMSSRTYVIKLGGSFLLAGGSPNASLLTGMAATIQKIRSKGVRLIVVVGGGVVARQYVQAATAVGANNGVKDHFGILVSRLNARLFIEALADESNVFCEPCETLQQVRSASQLKPIVVLGGLQPGQSTTGVAALCAEYVKAERVVFCTDVGK